MFSAGMPWSFLFIIIIIGFITGWINYQKNEKK